LIEDLTEAGFYEIAGGKGSHRKLTHLRYRGAVTISGKLGDDAKPYQEKQVKSIDFRTRKARKISWASSEVLEEVLSLLDACIY
jgi:predicted RNA binding protein YcfA (HicA-like mRNA interferase family)